MEVSLPDTSKFRNLNIKGTVSPDNYTGETTHATKVLDIVSSVAPDADYYLGANSSSKDDISVIESLLDFGVNIITASRTIPGDGNGRACQYDVSEKWLDHIAYQHDVHFIKSAGNLGAGYQAGQSGPNAGAMAYNIIAVGNLYVNGTTKYDDDTIWTGSGPSSYYTGNKLANKPDICAPGQGVITNFGDFGGTSAATPFVAGAIALVCEQRPALKTQQTTVKAILTAGVNFDSKHGYTPANSNYQKYGAGLLDCVGACYVVAGYRYVNSNIAYGTTSKTHSFTVTNSDSRIRVSLVFNVKSSGSGTNHSPASTSSVPNLNIQVKDPNGKVVGSSTTTNNNVEIVDFKPTTTGTYSIVVQRVTGTSDPAETVYYGLAWR